MSTTTKTGPLSFTVGLALCGWVIMLAGVARLQALQAKIANHSVDTRYGSFWWLVCFQLVVGVLLAGASIRSRTLRTSALALGAVVTATCFYFTLQAYALYSFYNNYSDYSGNSYTTNFQENLATAHTVLFAGTIICSIGDALTLYCLGSVMSEETQQLQLLAAKVTQLETAQAGRGQV